MRPPKVHNRPRRTWVQFPIVSLGTALSFAGLDKVQKLTEEVKARKECEKRAHSELLVKQMTGLKSEQEARHQQALSLLS